MDKPLRVLMIEDVGSDAKLILMTLEKAGFRVVHVRVQDADGLKSAIENETWDVVIADYQLPGFNASAALSILRKSGRDIPFIVVSGFVGEETAVDLMKAGAHDYLMKDNLARLAPAVERELQDAEARRERRRMESALRESEIQYRTSLDSMNDFVHVLDADFRLILINRAFLAWNRQLTLPTDVIGRNLFEVYPFLPDRVREEYTRVFETGEIVVTEESTRVNDMEFITDTRKIPIHEAGRVVRVLTVIRDVTERRRTLEALRESEEQFRRVFEDIPIGMALSDENSRFIKANSAFCGMLGYTEPELARMSFRDITHPDHLSHDVNMVRKVRDGEMLFYKTDKRYIKKTGDIIWGSLTLSAIRKPDGTIRYFLAMIEDITEKRTIEEALKESEKKYRSIFENSIEGIFQSTPQGRYISINPALARMCGYDSPAQMMDSVTDISKQIYRHGTDRSRFIEALTREGIVNDFVTEFLRKDGTHFWVSTNARVIRDERGECRHFEGMTLDITNRKILEDRIREDIREKNVLLKEVHHRVKNNLQIIVSLLNLQSGKIKDRKILAAFDEVRHRVYSMALLHEKLYKSENFAEVPFKDYLSTLCRDLVSAFGATGRLRLDFDLEEIDLSVDTALPCGLIVNELITNAIKHAFPKGREGRIDVRFKRTDAKAAELTVADDGTGLPAGLDVARAETLGLKIIHILTDQINGKMHVRSRRGASFRLVFPIRNRTARSQRQGSTVVGRN